MSTRDQLVKRMLQAMREVESMGSAQKNAFLIGASSAELCNYIDDLTVRVESLERQVQRGRR